MKLFNTLIIGIDPGKTVGFARLYHNQFTTRDVPYQEAVDELDRLTAWAQKTHIPTPFVISIERFTLRKDRTMTAQHDALELIGVARYMARSRGAFRFMVNGVSDAQRVGSPAVLRQLGWWVPNGDHLNKAGAQVAYAVANLWTEDFAELTGV